MGEQFRRFIICDQRRADNNVSNGNFQCVTASLVLWPEFLAADPEVWVPLPALPDFLRSSDPGTGSTQPREYSRGATWEKKKWHYSPLQSPTG
jgi:hypothetical protein